MSAQPVGCAQLAIGRASGGVAARHQRTLELAESVESLGPLCLS
jgi:hypothetical protein